MDPDGLFHSVIIASTGRRDILGETVRAVLKQTRPPDEVIVAIVGPDDFDPSLLCEDRVRVVHSPGGLTRQLNTAVAGLDARCRTVTIFDDDVEPADNYLDRVVDCFRQHPEMALFDGWVLQDGQISREDARKLLAAARNNRSRRLLAAKQAYGCNMNVRRAVLEKVRFDERLPQYAWNFDLDFSRRVRGLGCAVARNPECRLVHLASGVGRLSEQRFGYSQVVNPVYI